MGGRGRGHARAGGERPTVEHGERYFALGDRVLFLKNDRELGVKNGTLGRVAEVGDDAMRVVLDGPERRGMEAARARVVEEKQPM